MQRLANGKFLAISGGDWRASTSHVFIVRMGTRRKVGPWGSNALTKDRRPPDEDRIVRIIGVDQQMWHAGGMDVMGDILAVPVEYPPPKTLPLKALANLPLPHHGNRPSSRIVFLDVKNPLNPRRLRPTIERLGVKATAVALTKLPNGHYLAAVFSAQGLDLYLSKTKNFASGFRDKATTWHPHQLRALDGQPREFGGFQTINFISQSNGRLYLVGLRNTSPMPPTIGGDNNVELFTVDIPDTDRKPADALGGVSMPTLTRVASRRFECKHRQCNMAAAAGAYVDHGRLIVYSAYHWRHRGILRFNEFCGLTRATKRTVTHKKDGWIELFEKSFFRGRYLTIRGGESADIADFGELRVQGSGFDNKVRSVRFQLPAGATYTLFRGKNFKRKIIDLLGTGAVSEVADLRDHARDRDVSSARLQD